MTENIERNAGVTRENESGSAEPQTPITGHTSDKATESVLSAEAHTEPKPADVPEPVPAIPLEPLPDSLPEEEPGTTTIGDVLEESATVAPTETQAVSAEEHTRLLGHPGRLFVVSTPIGNHDDISLRALETFKKADVIVCEEARVGARLLRQYRISKTIRELNEHNEAEQNPLLLEDLKSGKYLALISDCGTPLLADPGAGLVRMAVQAGIEVKAVPGASAIMTALVTSTLPMQQFLYAGFVAREPGERRRELEKLARETRTVVLLETPYRLLPLLESAATIIPQRRAYIGCNLTMSSETHHYGTVSELYEKFRQKRFKGEFVLCFEGAPEGEREVQRPRFARQGERRGGAPGGAGRKLPHDKGFRRGGGKPGAKGPGSGKFRKRDDSERGNTPPRRRK